MFHLAEKTNGGLLADEVGLGKVWLSFTFFDSSLTIGILFLDPASERYHHTCKSRVPTRLSGHCIQEAE